MQVVTGRNSVPWERAAVEAFVAAFDAVLVDLGSGDGAFVGWLAGRFPRLACVGVDANAERLASQANRAGRKPARGGRPNACFVAARLEELPPELDGLADLVTIHFPWAGLLEVVVRGDPLLAQALGRLARPDAALQILVNADAEIPSLPAMDPASLAAALAPTLAAAGFRATRAAWLPASARVHSEWGGRLMRGSGRRIACLRAQRGRGAGDWTAALDAAIGDSGTAGATAPETTAASDPPPA